AACRGGGGWSMKDRRGVVERVGSRRGAKVVENEPVGHAALSPSEAEILTGVLENVVQEAPGTRASLPGGEVAGKRGRNANSGPPWFVGYPPPFHVAVWVVYPNHLKP